MPRTYGCSSFGLPCVETVNCSLLVNYPFEFPNAYDEHLVSVILLTSSGPLAAFNTIHATSDYFEFFNSANEEIDINGPFGEPWFS